MKRIISLFILLISVVPAACEENCLDATACEPHEYCNRQPGEPDGYCDIYDPKKFEPGYSGIPDGPGTAGDYGDGYGAPGDNYSSGDYGTTNSEGGCTYVSTDSGTVTIGCGLTAAAADDHFNKNSSKK